MISLLIFFVLFLHTSSCQSHSPVHLFTEENIAEIKEGHWAVLFYTKDCTSCTSKRKEWEDFALGCQVRAPALRIAEVNCSQTVKLCRKWVTAIPMYYFIIHGNAQSFPPAFSGSVDGWMSFYALLSPATVDEPRKISIFDL
eukprot:TRINITY_DN6190_c0_g1_i3.p1 TRINITY_DN6190_c0_g1~~TRINITY_DN6190_c0_g1_i3.p1  ORF type:complete len:142 (+),score=10.06 TRINITY_DN6190_c0_g1_i3:154-579(+)